MTKTSDCSTPVSRKPTHNFRCMHNSQNEKGKMYHNRLHHLQDSFIIELDVRVIAAHSSY